MFDDYQLGTMTQQGFDRVKELVDEGKRCPSRKAAEPIIKRLKFLAGYECKRCEMKIIEIADILSEYCKVGADKDKQGWHLYNAIGTLKGMIAKPME
jgi:hypothetical protein